MTKIFPVFFAFICFGLNAGAILYFVVSNIWRIGQQQLVLGKLYDQGVAAGQIKAGPRTTRRPSKATTTRAATAPRATARPSQVQASAGAKALTERRPEGRPQGKPATARARTARHRTVRPRPRA